MIKKYFAGVFGFLFTCLLFLWCTTGNNVPTGAPLDDFGVSISTIDYNPATDRIDITWTAATGTVNKYYIYISSGNDTSDGDFIIRDSVDGSMLTYSDIPGFKTGNYHYKVAAGGNTSLGNYMVGKKSDYKTIEVLGSAKGKIVINDGDNFTAKRAVKLALGPASVLTHYSITTAVDSAGDPDFTAIPLTALPASDTDYVVIDTAYLLPLGGGVKYVYAQVQDTSGTLDTISNFISPAEHEVFVSIQNNDFRKIDPLYGSTKRFRISTQKNIEFSISVNTDSELLDTNFSVWVVVNADGSDGIVDHDNIDNKPWLETKPLLLKAEFSNSDYVYEYDLENDSLGLYKEAIITKAVKDVNTASFPDSLRTTGNYWGPYGDSVLSGMTSPDYIFKLSREKQYSMGYKEFFVVCEFKGRYFQESKFVLSRSDNDVSQTVWDFYQPGVQFDKDKSGWSELKGTPVEGEIITGPFDVYLHTATPVIDYGYAMPREATLYFVYIPEDSVDNFYKDSTSTEPDGDLFTLDMLEEYSNFPYPKYFPENNYFAIRQYLKWKDMFDPVKSGSEWVTGYYVMLVVTGDHLGNRGIAPYKKDADESKNPRFFYIKTNQPGR